MIKLYDNNSLVIKNISCNLTFDLKLRGHLVQVDGASGTGKTLLFNTINDIRNFYLNNKMEDINVFAYDINSITIDKLKSIKNSLIVVDRCNLLSPDLVSYINSDKNNTYIVLGRGNLGFNLSPNYFATLVTCNNTVSLNYDFSEVGWF